MAANRRNPKSRKPSREKVNTARASNVAAIAAAAVVEAIKATIADRAITSPVTRAMNHKASVRISQAANKEVRAARANVASKAAVAGVAVAVVAVATVMTARDHNPKVSKAAVRFDRAF